MAGNGSLRIGVDTGGTFTDVTALRSDDGAIFAAKIPSTPSDPSQALDAAIRKILEMADAAPADVSALVHGTTVATNALLGRPSQDMCLIVNDGFRHILEIARQSVPDGFGSSYFWVKPGRLVTPDRVYEIGGRIDFKGEEITPFDEEQGRDLAYKLKKMGIETVAVCLLHSYANPAHERMMRSCFEKEHAECYVSLSSEVLPEYQEYERAVATLLDAACKPVIKSYVDRAIESVANDLSESTPFLIMKSNGGVTHAPRAMEHPLTIAMSGPAAGVFACAEVADAAGIQKAISLDAGGTSTEVSLLEGGAPHIASSSKLGNYTINVPMIDVVTVGTGGGSIAWISKDGRLRVGPRSAGADPGPMCYGKGGDEPTVTDAHLFLGHLPGRLAGGEISLLRERAEEGLGRIAESLGIPPVEAAQGILEMAAWNQALAIRQMTVHQGKDPREYALIAFGGAGPLMAAEIAAALGVNEIIVPPRPGCGSATGLVEVAPRYDYVKTHMTLLDQASHEDIFRQFESMMSEAEIDLRAENMPEDEQTFTRAIDLRFRGESREMTIEISQQEPFSDALGDAVKNFHGAYHSQFGHRHPEGEPVELVNLRLTASGNLNHTQPRGVKPGSGAEAALTGEREAHFAGAGFVSVPLYDHSRLGQGDSITGPAVIEDFGSTTIVPPGSRCELDRWGNLRIHLPAPEKSSGSATGGAAVHRGPIVHEIIEGALRATEKEMEDFVERMARSTLMRDMHQYRVGLFDRKGRKLTGRSISAAAGPVLRNWKLEDIFEGDVFIWNDAYLSEGGVGHLPNLCACVPIFHQGELTAFSLAVGHFDDIGGMVSGGQPAAATEIYQEGILVPPIKLYERGVLNDAALLIVSRNSRFPEYVHADINAQVAACRAGGARIGELCNRFGMEVVIEAFDALLEKCISTVRDELLPKIPDGAYEWEDYIERDGVEKNKAHTLKVKMTKAKGKLTLDFRGTSPQAAGPINWPVDYADGLFLKQWIAPLLLNLAGSYERMFEIDINEGIASLIDIIFPEPGSLITPVFPAPTSMQPLTALRMMSLICGVLGMATKGRLPADQETVRCWGLRGRGPDGKPFCFREILGGGMGGRPWADGEDTIHAVPGSQNLPAEVTEGRFPVHVERMGLAPDSGGPGKRRGGLGYFKEFRVLCDCAVFSQGDRSVIAPWGVNGGRGGGLYQILINPETPVEREVPSLTDGVDAIEGDLIRVVTTGGGGWGNPYERELQYVRRDVIWGKVTFQFMGHTPPDEEYPVFETPQAMAGVLSQWRRPEMYDKFLPREKVSG